MLELILLIIGFVLLSGIMALVEAAIISISRAEVEEMVYQKKHGASALRILSHKLTRAVIVLVIITNIVNILGPILVGQKAIALYGNVAIGIVTAILTFATILFSEIIPKSLGTHYAPRISRAAAPVILSIEWALYPLIIFFEMLANVFKSGKRSIGTEDQIRSLTSIGRLAGHIESDEGQLVHRAFLLNDKNAEDIMTPLKYIVSVRETSTIREAADEVFKHPYSRYPVFGKSIHDVKGISLSQDILEALSEGRDSDPVSSIQREGLVVPSTKRCDNLLALFRDRHIHLAIVQKNHKTVGLVTLEDVLEELVGEIEDEHDVEE